MNNWKMYTFIASLGLLLLAAFFCSPGLDMDEVGAHSGLEATAPDSALNTGDSSVRMTSETSGVPPAPEAKRGNRGEISEPEGVASTGASRLTGQPASSGTRVPDIQPEGNFGRGHPLSIAALPQGPLKEKLQTLSVEKQEYAVEWLQSFSFSAQDAAHSLRADRNGGIFYVCALSGGQGDGCGHPNCHHDTAGAEQETGAVATVGTAAAQPETVVSSESGSEPVTAGAAVPVTTPLPSSLIFHSKPGAPNILYLNFEGQTVEGTAWNDSPDYGNVASWDCLPFSRDSDYTTYSDTEQAQIKRIWQRVAEDYAPFDVDVTTERPADWGTNNRCATALITRNTDANGVDLPHKGAGGIAYVNVFGRFDYASYYSPAFVLDMSTPNIAEASSHEIGHNVGLSHDGTSSTIYYSGHGSGETSWGPIMGSSYGENVTQWSKGEYYDANQTQDDLFIISGDLGYRVDDHGNSPGTATELVDYAGVIRSTTPEDDPDNDSTENKGMIELDGDVDVFSFFTGSGEVTLNVDPWRSPFNTNGGNLDIVLELYNSGGALVATSDPSSTTDAGITTTLVQGTYYLHITNTGVGDPFSSSPTGYTSYASLGQYFISGNIVDAITPPRYSSQSPGAEVATASPLSQISVTFNREMDPATFSIAEDILGFTGPDGSDLSASITGAIWSNSNKTLSIDFNGQSAEGYYRMVFGSYIASGNGFLVDQDQDGNPGELQDDSYAAYAFIGGSGGNSATVWSDLLGTDMATGWSFSGGTWATGDANEDGSSGPAAGADGNPIIGQNLSGNYNAGENSYAQSASIDASLYTDLSLSFQGWKGAGKNDDLYVDVSANNWSSATRVYAYTGPNGGANDTSWSNYTLDLSAFDGSSNLQIRWGLEDTNNPSSGERTGWQLDQIELTGIATAVPPPPPQVLSHDPEGEINLATASIWINFSQPMDPTGFSLVEDIDSFSGPSGSITPTGYIWVNESTLRIDFAEQSTAGTYSLVLAPTIPDLNGVDLDQDGDGLTGESVDDRYTAAFTISSALVVTSLTPLDDESGVDSSFDLVVGFNQSVTLGTGNILVKNLSDGTSTAIDVTDGSQVLVSGSTLTINPASDLLPGKNYAIQIEASAIQNFAGILDDTTWNFQTTDLSPPTIISLSPADGTGGVSLNADLVVTFDENVTPANGHITLKNLSDNSQSTISVTDESQVTFSGTSLTINPANDLTANSTYAIRITPGAVKDEFLNGFEGINNDTIWNFSTPDTLPPVLLSLSPADDASDVALDTNLIASFNEPITAASGDITIKDLTNETQFVIDVTDTSQVTITDSTLTVNPASDLLAEADYAVLIDAGVVVDASGNGFDGISDGTVWNFATLAPPSIVGLDPATGSSSVPIASDLSVTFDETIATGAGNITIRNLTDATDTVIDITDTTQISVSDATLTIDPAGNLLGDKSYAVRIEAGAVEDTSGNSFAGITDDSSWAFATNTTESVIYEPFEDSDATLSGNSGGTGIEGSWSGSASVVAGNLDYGNLPAAVGNQVAMSNQNGYAAVGSVLNANGLLADGATLWFSVLIKTGGDINTNGDLGFALGSESVNSGNDLPISNSGEALGLTFKNGQIRGSSWTSAGLVRSSNNGTNSASTETLYLVAGKFTWGADSDTIELYFVDTDLNKGAVVSTHTVNMDQSLFDTLSVASKAATPEHFVDEIRFGASYDAVMGLGGTGPGPVDNFVISEISGTQTVGTEITGITITAQDSSNNVATGFTGTVSFGGTGGFSGTSANFVDGVLSNVSLTPTEAGSDLTLTVDDGAGHTGSTTIATIQTAYEGWSEGSSPETDSNGDGIADGIAWVLGASDPSSDATALLPTSDSLSDADYLIFTYRRSDEVQLDANATVEVEYSSGLSNWTTAVDDGANVVITESDDFYGTGVDQVEVKVHRDLAVGARMFMRLRVTISL